MFCPNCGKYTEDGSLFCGECGTSLKEYWQDMEPDHSQQGQAYSGDQQSQAYYQQGQAYSGDQQSQAYYQQGQAYYGDRQSQAYYQQGQAYSGDRQSQAYYQQGQPYPGGPGPHAQPAGPMKAPRKPLNKKVLIAVGEGVLAVGLLVGAFQIMGNKFSAEAVVENYWEAVSNCDWGSVYDYCEFPESELLTAQNFVNIHADDTEVLKYKSVKFMDAGTKMSQMLNDYRDLFGSSSRENEADLEEMDQKLYYVEYTVKGDSGSHSDEIVVVKTGEKKCLFWDEWKVVPSDFVVQDYEFEVPNNASVTLNGVELSSLPGVKKEYEEGDSWAYLQVPYLFSGEYQLEASREGMETYRTLVDIRYSNDYCYVPELQPSQALIESMAQRAADDVQKLYLAMFNLQPFDTVQDMFSEEALQDEYIRSEYESIVEDFSSMSIASITMDGMTVSVNYLYPDEISFYVDFHYRESYYVNGQLQEEEGNENSYVSYVYENGAWKLSDFDD